MRPMVPPLQGGDRCGKSTNFWEYYEADIERAVSLNSTCFRLSLGAPPLQACSASSLSPGSQCCSLLTISPRARAHACSRSSSSSRSLWEPHFCMCDLQSGGASSRRRASSTLKRCSITTTSLTASCGAHDALHGAAGRPGCCICNMQCGHASQVQCVILLGDQHAGLLAVCMRGETLARLHVGQT